MPPSFAGLAVLALALAAVPTALAGEGGTVTADAPVVVDGAGVARTTGGGLLVLGGEGGAPFELLITAGELTLDHTTHSERCVAGVSFLPCHPDLDPGSSEEELVVVRDARVTVTGAPRADFIAGLTLRAEDFSRYDGGAESTLEARHAEPAGLATVHGGSGWATPPTPPSGQGAAAPYAAGGDDFEYAMDDVQAEAFGHLAMTLRGVDVRVVGVTEDGASFDRTFRPGAATEPSGATETRSFSVLVLESPDGAVDVAYDGPAALYGSPEIRSLDRVNLENAKGSFERDGESFAWDGDDAEVEGEIELVPISADSTDSRVALLLSPVAVAAPLPAPEESLAPLAAFRAAGEDANAAATGAAALGAVGLLAALAYWWPALRYSLTALLLPLYSRIERDEVLTHGKRDEIYALIRNAPGIHAHEISSKVNIGWGTTVYHLRLLESHHLVVSKRAGRYKRFYLNSGAVGARKDAYGALRNETTARVGEYVMKNPGATQKDVCDALGLSPSLVSWHVARLEESDLVKKVKEGRRVRYFAGPGWNEINLAVVPALAHTAATVTPAVAVADGGVQNN